MREGADRSGKAVLGPCIAALWGTGWPSSLDRGQQSGTRVNRVGEYSPLIGPAPDQMVAPVAGLFAFQVSVMTYVGLGVRAMTVSRYAALGDKVPANPPDSFHPSGWPTTVG